MSEFKLDTIKKDRESLWNVSKKIDTVYPLLEASVNAHKVHYSNQLVMTFNGGFGSTNSIDFPSQHKFIRSAFVEFQFTVVKTGDGVVDAKSDYISHNMLKQVEWNIGSTDRIRRYNSNIVMEQLLQCESDEKKERMLALSGRAGALPAGVHRFYAMLPLPWCSMSSKNKPKPFPVYLLQKENLRIDLTLALASELFTITPNTGTASVTLNKVQVYYETGKLNTLEKYTMPSQGEPVVYPFLLPFDQVFTLNQTQTEVNLTGLRSAEVSDILLQIVANGQLNQGKKIKNIKLTLSGQVIWQSYNDGQEMWDLVYDDVPRTHCKNIVDVHTGNAQATGGCKVFGETSAQATSTNFDKFYYYVIPIAEAIQKSPHSKLLGADFDKETLKLEIERVGGADQDKLAVSYRYQTAYGFLADGSVAQIY